MGYDCYLENVRRCYKNWWKNSRSCQEAAEESIEAVEDYPFFKSVGCGGLPNEEGEVELDVAFMDDATLSIGAIVGIKDLKNPISIAKKLSEEKFNIFLVGVGAESYAHKNGFERQNMLTEKAKYTWEKRKKRFMNKIYPSMMDTIQCVW